MSGQGAGPCTFDADASCLPGKALSPRRWKDLLSDGLGEAMEITAIQRGIARG